MVFPFHVFGKYTLVFAKLTVGGGGSEAVSEALAEMLAWVFVWEVLSHNS